METLIVSPLSAADRAWVRSYVAQKWFAEQVVVHGTVYTPHTLPGLAAWLDGQPVGLLTYTLFGDACEIVSLDSDVPGKGIGTALMAAAESAARAAGCCRVWLVTTNDNLTALGFYQKRGYRLVRVDRGAVDAARKLKPEIPQIGEHGIPLHDEIVLEKEIRG